MSPGSKEFADETPFRADIHRNNRCPAADPSNERFALAFKAGFASITELAIVLVALGVSMVICVVVTREFGIDIATVSRGVHGVGNGFFRRSAGRIRAIDLWSLSDVRTSHDRWGDFHGVLSRA